MKHLKYRVWGWALLTMGLTTGTALASGGHGGAEPSMTHRMMMLAIQLGIILFSARLSNMLFERMKLPGVLGELTAGILIGPYALGMLPIPALFPEGIFPLASAQFPVSPELYGICSVAAIVLLFTVGLETDLKLFMRYSLAGSLVGVGGVTVSFLGGDLLGVAFSESLFGSPRGIMDAGPLFLGVMSTATSVGITARILSEKRKLDSPEGVTILAGAVIDDVLGIILLAVGLGVISASREGGGTVDWAHIGLIGAKAIGIWLAATVVGLLASRRISKMLKSFGDRSSIAMLALGLALILAGLFEEAGLAMIIGAYVMGLSLSRTDISHVIRENLKDIYAFLVPVFFVVMGMLVNPRVLVDPKVLSFGLIYTVVAILAKVIGSGGPALLCNFNCRGALRIGVGMLPRGEVALIIAGIGLAAGLLTPEIFGVGVLMTLLTTLLAPPILVLLFGSEASGLRKQSVGPVREPLVFSFPSRRVVSLVVDELFSAFESEGFFVHTLSHEERIYQLRKDDVIIGFEDHGETLVFDCETTQMPFVNTAMVEVLAELEATIQELRKPIDRKAIGKRLQDHVHGSVSSGSLAEYISPRVLTPELKGTTKEEIIGELLQILKRAGKVTDVPSAHEAVWHRERSMSTGMQFGMAIPHGRTDAVDRLVCAIGIKHEGVDFDSIDDEPARIFVLTLSPRTAAAPHMLFMSMVSQVLNQDGRRRLLRCRTGHEMVDLLLGKPAIVRDLDRRGQVSHLETDRKAASRRASLVTYLNKDLLLPELEATTKEGAIRELVEVLHRTGRVGDVDSILDEILVRESQMSTGMEHGLAIPHARTDQVKALVCAIGLKKEGVDFGAMDDQPSTILVLTLSPRTAPGPQVQFMAMIGRALNAEGRKRLLASETSEDMWGGLTRALENAEG